MPRMFWFVFWRMALWGLGLGSGLGAAYGTLVGLLFGPYSIFGPPLGAMYGSIAGLPLGLLEGAVLGKVTMLRYRRDAIGDPLRYRRAAKLGCVVACVVTLASFFELAARRSGTSFVSGPAYDSEDVVFLFILIIGPSLVAAVAFWWAARRVAEQYINEFGEPANRGPAQASSENSTVGERGT
jgi:hypothetical protein